MTDIIPLVILKGIAKALQEGRRRDADRMLQGLGDDVRTAAALPYEFGMRLLETGDPFAATMLLALAVERAPRSADAWKALGHAFRRRDAPRRAIQAYERAIGLGGETSDLMYNLGESFLAIDAVEEARRALERADQLQPSGTAHMSLANLERHLFRYPEAQVHFRRAFHLLKEGSEENIYCHTMLGITALLVGDYETGWAEYEWRLHHVLAEGHAQWNSVLPHWDGVIRPGLRLIVYCEQGLGDTLQFVRYCRWLMDRDVRVTLMVQASLAPLILRQSPPLAERVLAEGTPISAAEFDAHVSLMSLPAKLLASWGRMEFMTCPYLKAAPEKVERANTVIHAKAGSRPAIGVAWAGNPRYPHDHERSLTYDQLAPLVVNPDIAFFAIQFGAEREKLTADPNAVMIDITDEMPDFDASAALYAAFDGIITVDSAPTHLAGALGRPVAVLVPRRNDWRWGMPPATRSPWYPSVTLYRQQQEGRWDDELALLAARLRSGEAFNFDLAPFEKTE